MDVTVKDNEKSVTYLRYDQGEADWKRNTDKIFKASWSHKCPTYVHRTAPCQGSCPSGHNIRGWLAVARGQEKPREGEPWQALAWRMMVDANPFPAIMGRVCPAPCEDGCNRNQLEDHVGINAVEHYVGDWAIQNGMKLPTPETESGRHVAVVGGGPAGLAAAYFLRRDGHKVTVFEAKEQLGGWVRYGIPGYRTPREVLDAEINRIVDMGGIEVKTGTKVGRDISMEDLERNHDAVFWGIGTQAGRHLPIPGWEGTPNCISGVDFLRAFNEGRLQMVTPKVVVIGGGDTSIDVASVARRLGHITETHDKDRPESVIWGNTAHDVASSARRDGADVILTSLFPVEKMFAAEREVRDARHEGVNIQGSVMPLEVIKDADGRATGLKMCECDMDGNSPVPRAGTEYVIEVDLLVSAIGQSGDLEGIEAMGNDKGFINADRTYRIPGHEKHFVGGDIVRPHLLTTAVGHARVAAETMRTLFANKEPGKRPKVDVHHFSLLDELRYHGLQPESYDHESHRGTAGAEWAVHNYEDRGRQDIIPWDDLYLGHFSYTPRAKRDEVQVGAEEVIGDFRERSLPLTEEQAQYEGKRCMSCGMCFECDNCVIYCPQDAVHRYKPKERAVGRYVYTEYSRCIGCHICFDVCPTGYIQMGLGE